jgi:hypothetical protein
MICRSTVMTSAEHFASFARAKQPLHEVVVLAACRPGTRRALTCGSATSSIEQIDMVDSVKGTPNFSAAAPP